MTPLSRRDRLLIQHVGDELLVYDQERHWAHRLNQAAALIWRHCDGKTTIPELASLLRDRLKLPADEELVQHALRRLEKAHLVSSPVEPPAQAISRRHLLRRLGKVAAIALLVPTVTTIVAPTPALAQSGTSTGFSCRCLDSHAQDRCCCCNNGCGLPVRTRTECELECRNMGGVKEYGSGKFCQLGGA